MRSTILRALQLLGACGESIDWVRTLPKDVTGQEAWDACTDPFWMCWLIERADHALADQARIFTWALDVELGRVRDAHWDQLDTLSRMADSPERSRLESLSYAHHTEGRARAYAICLADMRLVYSCPPTVDFRNIKVRDETPF